MLPSPSLGPPWLSASASPALAPWGMPLELEAELPPEDFELVAADPPEEPVDWDAGAGDALEELEEFEPQAATPSATSTIASGISRRIVVGLFDFMNRSFTPGWEAPASSM